MRSPRLALALTALLAVTALAGCSGDDEEPANSSTPADAAGESDGPKIFDRRCDVSVELSGSVEASWSGKGRSSNEAGPTIYSFEQDDNMVTVYAGNDDLATSANVTVDGATYTTTDPETGLDVQAKGRQAEVDADLSGVDGAGPHVTASFACGKSGKGKGGKS